MLLGLQEKRGAIRRFIKKKIDILLQETKWEERTKNLLKEIWGVGECDSFYKPSDGRSGELLILWKPSTLNISNRRMDTRSITNKGWLVNEGVEYALPMCTAQTQKRTETIFRLSWMTSGVGLQVSRAWGVISISQDSYQKGRAREVLPGEWMPSQSSLTEMN